MPICKNCDKYFPYKLKQGKRTISLTKRKYCFECSPFGAHNTRPFGYIRVTHNERSCEICNKPYKGKGLLCYSCQKMIYRYEIKAQAVAYLGGKCKECGYNKCNASLVFHHSDPNEKDFTISGNTTVFEKLKPELDKCILLCHNCHNELHWNEHKQLRQLLIARSKKI